MLRELLVATSMACSPADMLTGSVAGVLAQVRGLDPANVRGVVVLLDHPGTASVLDAMAACLEREGWHVWWDPMGMVVHVIPRKENTFEGEEWLL